MPALWISIVADYCLALLRSRLEFRSFERAAWIGIIELTIGITKPTAKACYVANEEGKGVWSISGSLLNKKGSNTAKMGIEEMKPKITEGMTNIKL